MGRGRGRVRVRVGELLGAVIQLHRSVLPPSGGGHEHSVGVQRGTLALLTLGSAGVGWRGRASIASPMLEL